MTKTYHDIDAVTRLLQEKEKDLELAAKIGQVKYLPRIFPSGGGGTKFWRF
jgi:hypothetical protein